MKILEGVRFRLSNKLETPVSQDIKIRDVKASKINYNLNISRAYVSAH